MRDIIIASPSDKVRAQLRGFVADMGIMGVIECRSASQTLDFVRRLPAAIIICQQRMCCLNMFVIIRNEQGYFKDLQI